LVAVPAEAVLAVVGGAPAPLPREPPGRPVQELGRPAGLGHQQGQQQGQGQQEHLPKLHGVSYGYQFKG